MRALADQGLELLAPMAGAARVGRDCGPDVRGGAPLSAGPNLAVAVREGYGQGCCRRRSSAIMSFGVMSDDTSTPFSLAMRARLAEVNIGVPPLSAAAMTCSASAVSGGCTPSARLAEAMRASSSARNSSTRKHTLAGFDARGKVAPVCQRIR